MATKTPTFESVDKIVGKANLAAHRPGGRHHFTARAAAIDPGSVIGKICPIWSVVKPILSIVKLPLPKKWKDAIDTFTSVLDTLCPAS